MKRFATTNRRACCRPAGLAFLPFAGKPLYGAQGRSAE